MSSRVQDALFEAITLNNMTYFRNLLTGCWGNPCSAIASRDMCFRARVTPLSYACSLKRFEMAKPLLQFASDEEIRFAFQFAVNHFSGNVELVRAFISHGVDVNCEWNDEDTGRFTTPLLAAIRYTNLELLKYLLECGADINPRDPDHTEFVLENAIQYFQKERGLSIVNFLLTNGVDVNENKGKTLGIIFEFALENHRWEEVFDMCVDRGAKLDFFPFMYYAAKADNINMVKYLIARGMAADSEVRYNGHTALHVAGCNGASRPSLVEMLLKWGTDPNAQVKAIGDDVYDTFLVGFSALHYACSQGDLEKVELLLDYGADVHSVNCSNVSVLFQLLDAICKDKSLYEFMVFSSEKFADESSNRNIGDIREKAETRLERYEKMTRLLLASGATLLDEEWLVDYNKPYVVMCVDVLAGSSEFLTRTRALIEHVKCSLKSPRSLTDLCRSTVRTLLPVNTRDSVGKLEGILPKALISVLVFDDILTSVRVIS